MKTGGIGKGLLSAEKKGLPCRFVFSLVWFGCLFNFVVGSVKVFITVDVQMHLLDVFLWVWSRETGLVLQVEIIGL